MPTFRHVLLLGFRPDATPEGIAAVFEGLAGLADEIEVIRSYQFGRDLGLGDGRFDMALVADFDSESAWRLYSEHPAHQRFVRGPLAAVAGETARAQYIVEDPA